MGGGDCSQCPNVNDKPDRCESEEPIVWQDQVEASIKCPNLDLPKFEKYFTAFNFYKAGFLPHEGGWLNQPNTFIDIIQIIAREEANYTREQFEKQREQ